MKILHTSDWHLGRTTFGQSRAIDHAASLAEITQIAATHRPDLIINSGDLFDQQRPPVQALQLATDALQGLAAIAPVVVIAGNHDSAPLLHWLHGLLRHGGRIHIVADPEAVQTGTIVRIPAAEGGRLHVAALPFITANRIVTALDDPSTRRSAYAEFIAKAQHDLLRRLHADFDATTDVSILAAHQYVSGSVPSNTENRNHTCDFYVTDPLQIPPVDYAAYGHIHRPQDLPGKRVVGAYPGSPIQLDFGEADEDKTVVLAHLYPGTPTRIERIPLYAGRRLRKLKGTLEQLRREAETVTDELCQVIVDLPTHHPHLSREIREIFPEAATIVDVDENAADRTIDLITPDTPLEAEPDNLTMFGAFLAERRGGQASAAQVLNVFGELLHHADDEQPPVLAAEELLAADLSAFAVPTDDEQVPA